MVVSEKMKEYQSTFARELPSMLEHHLGKYAVIGGPKPLGFWDDWTTAYKEGVKAYGLAEFLVQPVKTEQDQIQIPALSVGAITMSIR
jgi:hypothetical protein